MSGEAMIRAADEIEREAKRWENLRAVGAELRTLGSLEKAAEDAAKRRDQARAEEKRILDDLAAKQVSAAQQIADIDAHKRQVDRELHDARNDANGALLAAKQEADKIIADAEAERAKIIADAHTDALAKVSTLTAATATAETALADANTRLAAINAEIEERQALLDHIGSKLGAIGTAVRRDPNDRGPNTAPQAS